MKNHVRKDYFIFDTADDKLRQEAIAKDFTYEQVVKAALGCEQSVEPVASLNSLQGKASDMYHTPKTKCMQQ